MKRSFEGLKPIRVYSRRDASEQQMIVEGSQPDIFAQAETMSLVVGLLSPGPWFT